MRRWKLLLPALMMTLLLAACGGAGNAEARVEALRDAVAAAAEVSFTAVVRADVGGEEFCCTLRCTGTAEGCTAEVMEPEIIAGVTAHLAPGGAEIEFGGVSLPLALSGAPDLSPLTAAGLTADALRFGHVRRAWTERDTEGNALIAAELYVTDAAELTLWFGGEPLAPCAAELSVDGTLRAACEITDFSYK